MLALVKKPRIELSLQGDNVEELLAWIRRKYDVAILSADEEDSIPVEETEFWKEMEANRIGNLLSAARLRAGLTQAELAKKLGVRQNMISDYERGRRPLSSSKEDRKGQHSIRINDQWRIRSTLVFPMFSLRPRI